MRDLPVPGFSVYWGKPGLTVEVLDYHSTELLLGWDYIEGLATVVQKDPVRKNRGLGTGDVSGKLL